MKRFIIFITIMLLVVALSVTRIGYVEALVTNVDSRYYTVCVGNTYKAFPKELLSTLIPQDTVEVLVVSIKLPNCTKHFIIRSKNENSEYKWTSFKNKASYIRNRLYKLLS